MSKRRKRIKKDWEGESQKLTDFLCEIDLEQDFEQFSKYHFRVLGKIDIWPGSKTYFIRGTSGSLKYSDIRELKELLEFSKKTLREILKQEEIVKEM